MKTSDALYAAADYIRRHGFSPRYSERESGRPKCGCFIHAVETVVGEGDSYVALTKLRTIIFNGDAGVFGMRPLIEEGWNTNDAAAACEIAADIARAQGK